MTQADIHHIINDIKDHHKKLTEYSEKAQSGPFLNYYNNDPDFLHISGDGEMRNYQEFKKICTEYYSSLEYQKISSLSEKFSVIEPNLVIMGWTGNIIAHFKNGDIMKMNNYSITSMFKKIEGNWKIIHSHESALPPEIIKHQ